MNVFIVYAHPEPKSFGRALLDRSVQTLQAAGWAMQDKSGLWRLHTRLIQIATHFAHGIDAARRRLDEVHQRYTRTPT